MKILWVCNVKIPKIDAIGNKKNTNFVGGWLDGASELLLKDEDISLIYCYPNYESESLVEAHESNFCSYGIPMKYSEATKTLNNKSVAVDLFKKIVEKRKPDIIHFWGTEYLYALEFFKALKNNGRGYEEKTIISIQGLVSVYAKHFDAGVPNRIMNLSTLSELKGHCSLRLMKKSFEFRGEREIELLRNVKNVIGRTSWDEACTGIINYKRVYYKCNESLRSTFYSDQWNYKKCRPHQIFISQASYPIKGLHRVLEAVSLIKEQYPDFLIKVAGQDIFHGNKIKGNTYGNYIQNLIRKYGLENNIIFCGMMDAEDMKKTLLESNVFVSASAIENSPNSLGEAMLLGVPCVASDVGGCADMMEHKKEGFIYPFNESYKLAFYLCKIFENESLAENLGQEARKKALITHDKERNNEILCRIYEEMICKSST